MYTACYRLGCVKKVVTDLGVFAITTDGFVLRKCAPGVTEEEVRQKPPGDCLIISLPISCGYWSQVPLFALPFAR